MTTATLENTAVAAREATIATPILQPLIDASVAGGLLEAELLHRRDQLAASKPGDRSRYDSVHRANWFARNQRDKDIEAARAELELATSAFDVARKTIPDDTAAVAFRAENNRMRDELRRREQILAAFNKGVTVVPVMEAELARITTRHELESSREADTLYAINKTADDADAKIAWLKDRIAEIESARAETRANLDRVREQVENDLSAQGVDPAPWVSRAMQSGTSALNDRLASEPFPDPVF